MEWFSVPWWSALGTIILIDLVLAGDNALVIGIAASKLRDDLRKRAIFWGSVGALFVRGAMAMAVVWLLQVPGLLLAGGLFLLPVAYKLARPADESGDDHQASDSFWAAMKTIVIADALMGIDNVLAIGGAANGAWELVLIGLLITVPMIIYGSSWVAKAIIRWPILSAAGAAMLAWTAVSMIVKDPLFNQYVIDHPVFDWAVKIIAAAALFGIGYWALKNKQVAQPALPK